MKKYIIALDQGTTSSRAVLIDKEGAIINKAQKDITNIFPYSGWVEQDPMELLSSQVGVLYELITKNNINVKEIDSIGITNQRETTVIWEKKTGLPIYNAIVWQSRQSATIMENIVANGYSDTIQKKTGLIADAYFSASKIRWILDHVEGAQKRAENGELMFGTVDTWLLYHLSNKEAFMSDLTNASRTMLFNIHTLDWDDELLAMFNIPRQLLPQVKQSSEIYAHANIQGYSIPIAALIGDQQAALFGQTAFNPGEAKNTYGTGCFLLMNTGSKIIQSKKGLITSIAVGLNGQTDYCLEGSIFSGGSIVQWLRDDMELLQRSEDSSEIASMVSDDDTVYLIPAFTGLGAPYWDMHARASIVGLSRGTGRKHIIKAGLDAIAYQSYDVLKLMEEETQMPIASLYVDGGASMNEYLMQFQSNILQKDVYRPQTQETTALGAAYLAGLATGFFKDKESLKDLHKIDKKWHYTMPKNRQEHLLNGWKNALNRTLSTKQ